MSLSTSTITAAQYNAAGYAPTPDLVTPTAFARWPVAIQVDFVRTYGIGTPPAVLVGPSSGAQAIVRLNDRADRADDVEITPAPAGLNVAPGDVPVATFLDWPEAAQAFYVETNGRSGRLDIGPADAGIEARLENENGSVTITTSQGFKAEAQEARIFATPPADLSAADFFALPPDEQFRYADKYSSARPPSISLQSVGTSFTDIVVEGNRGREYVVRVPASTYPQFGKALTDLNSALPAATFQSWPSPVQTAYILAQAPVRSGDYPKTIVFDAGTSGTLIGLVRSKGEDAEIVNGPARFLSQSVAIPAATFLAWPQAAQIAFVQGNSRDNPPYDARPLLTLGPSGSTYDVRIGDDFPSVTLSSGPPATLPDPASLDLALFQMWSAGDQDRYVAAKGTGTPKTITIPADSATGRPKALLALDAAGHAAISLYPTSFSTAPTTLAASEFLDWPPIFQDLYTRANRTPGQASVVIGIGATVVRATPENDGTTYVQTGSSPLNILASPGQVLAIPYDHLLGSEVGLDPNPNRANAESLFPTLDGTAGHTIVDKPAAVLAEFGKAPTALSAEAFNSWHTAVQLEYLRKYIPASGSSVTIGTGTNVITAFISAGVPNPADTTAEAATRTIAGGNKVYIAENLQKQDIAKMSLADQNKLAGLAVFQGTAGLGAGLGLVGGATALIQMQVKVDAALARIANPSGEKGGDGHMPAADKRLFSDQLDNVRASLGNSAIFSEAEIDKQVDEIMTRFARANAFAVNLYDLNSRDPIIYFGSPYLYVTTPAFGKISEGKKPGSVGFATEGEWRDSFNNAFVTNENGANVEPLYFFQEDKPDVKINLRTYVDEKAIELGVGALQPYVLNLDPPPIVFGGSDLYINGIALNSVSFPAGTRGSPGLIPDAKYVSTDQNAKIRQGYDTFIAQERQLLSLQNTRKSLAETGTLQNRALDVPNLVYLFQLYTNLAGEAKIRIGTEEVDQTNALLKTYAVMQNLINKTVANFTGSDTNATQVLSGSGAKVEDPNDGIEYAFNALTEDEKRVSAMFTQGGGYSGAKHPIEALLGLSRPVERMEAKKSSAWQQFSTSVGQAVTQINQESQIKMNEINALTKQKDRNFDLANNALSKMSEIVQKIAGLN
ncbi:hypothetical protein [uncultured Methylobacterium sp.]|uniref:hypothetical protein n=1 Tax=uncultured Methylobacterium sp. TaxID=157278 RepID=UPI0035CAB5F0